MYNSITYFSLLAVVVASVAMLLNLGYLATLPKNAPKGGLTLVVVWLMLLVGMGQWFERSGSVTTVATVDTTAMLQVASIVIAAIVFLFLLGKSFRTSNLKAPLLFLLAYALVGVLTSPLSDYFTLSLFKSASLFIAGIIAVSAIYILYKIKSTSLLYNSVYVYFSLLIILALLGGILYPENTHRPSGSVLGYMLVGWPALNSNSLSYVAAVVFVISVHRVFTESNALRKILYFGICFAGLTALLLAQGRTSIFSSFLAFLFLVFAVREMAIMKHATVIVGIVLAAVYMLSGSLGEWLLSVEAYLRRGVSDEQIATLSGRTDAWSLAWLLFLESPIIGYGFYATGKTLVAPHNSYYAVLLNVGLLGFIPWLIAILGGYLKIFHSIGRRYLDRNQTASKYHKEIFAVMIVQFVRTITSQDLTIHSYSTLLFLAVLACIYANEKIRTNYEPPEALPGIDPADQAAGKQDARPLLRRKVS